MHERECKGYISFNRGVNELNRGVNELNRGVNELNRGVNHSVARQGCNLLRAAVTSAVTSQGCCCGNLQIHPLDLGQGHNSFPALLKRTSTGADDTEQHSESLAKGSITIVYFSDCSRYYYY